MTPRWWAWFTASQVVANKARTCFSPSPVLAHVVREGEAADVIHHTVGVAVRRGAAVEDGDHVGVLEPGDQLDLPLEPPAGGLRGERPREQHLDRHLSLGRALHGEVNDPLAALLQRAEDLIALDVRGGAGVGPKASAAVLGRTKRASDGTVVVAVERIFLPSPRRLRKRRHRTRPGRCAAGVRPPPALQDGLSQYDGVLGGPRA